MLIGTGNISTFHMRLSFPPPPGFTVGSLIGLKSCGGALLEGESHTR